MLNAHLVITGTSRPIGKATYSTETAIMRLLNDIYCNADNKARTLLLQLDLSAAFDTIDSDTLFKYLENTFGFSGCALQWLMSYLDN